MMRKFYVNGEFVECTYDHERVAVEYVKRQFSDESEQDGGYKVSGKYGVVVQEMSDESGKFSILGDFEKFSIDLKLSVKKIEVEQ